MAHPDVQLTTYEKVQFLWLFPLIVFKTLLSILSTVLTDKSTTHLARTAGTTFLRHTCRTLSLRQQLAPDVPTAATIARFCTSANLRRRTLPVPVPAPPPTASFFHGAVPAATLHLISVPDVAPSSSSSPSSSKRTLLYLHGGGYVHPVDGRGQLPLALRCAAAARAPTLAVLEYGLAPRLRHPGPLVQALGALRVLLRDEGVPPGEVVLLGDSAGGNAVLGVLACLRRGEGPKGWGLGFGLGEERLRGAVLVSPWCGVGMRAGSYGRNERWDFLTREGLAEFVEMAGLREGEVWGDMLGAAEVDGGEWGEGFWRGVVGGEGRVVERTLVTVGMREVFLDDVTEMARLMGAGEGGEQGSVQFVKCAKEVHVGAVVDVAIGIQDGEMLPAVLAFMKGL